MNFTTAVTEAKNIIGCVYTNNEFVHALDMIEDTCRFQLTIDPRTTVRTLRTFDKIVADAILIQKMEILVNPYLNMINETSNRN